MPSLERRTEQESVCDGKLFRAVIANFASGVAVITARHEETDYGITANAVTSVSLDPPILAVCVNRATGTHHAISESCSFGVSILHEEQGVLAQRFATPGEDKFAGVALGRGMLGVPLLEDALALLECRVQQETDGGTHTIFLGRVAYARSHGGSPLAYFRGKFGHLELEGHKVVYEELRSRVMQRDLRPGQALDVDQLARSLQAERSWIHHALSKLASEGLLSRHPLRGWVIIPVDAEISDAANDARCAIELGVVDLTVGRVGPERLKVLRERMKATLPLLKDNHFIDVGQYNEANNAFHECLVELADSAVLLDAYRRLSMPGIMARALSPSSVAEDEIVLDHRDIVEAYERGDKEAARKSVRGHNGRAKRVLRRAIEDSGGIV